MGEFNLNGDYFDYLYDRFLPNFEDGVPFRFRILFNILHGLEYYWVVPNDENRAADAYSLREDFYNMWIAENWPASPFTSDGAGTPPTFDEVFSGSCTVLEVLCALANRFENEIAHDDFCGNRESLWLWEMLCNMGVSHMNDRSITDQDVLSIKYRVQNVLDRRYGPHGYGGLFPRNDPTVPDQREVELWYQMQGYYSEKGVL